MKVIYGLSQIKKFPKPVVALGVFDGVHRAHISILKAVAEKARSIKGRSVVLTFWPHPQKEESIYSLKHRLRLIAGLGIDACIVVNFSGNFTKIPAADFVKDILLKKIGAHYIYVGKNFRFGRHAEGDFETLVKLSKGYGFKLKGFDVVKINNQPVSSTYIRTLIKKGDIHAAQKLLTRPVSVLGSVIKGNFMGRVIGFPTANINPHHEVIPPPGIYAVKIIFAGKKLSGVCYIGRRPTLNHPDKKIHIEVHIFNFKQHIYGKYLEIQFVKKIREDRKFPSFSALARQIRKDASVAKRLVPSP